MRAWRMRRGQWTMGEVRAVVDERASEGAANVLDVSAGYKHTELGVIPEDWRVSTVAAEFSVQLGKMLDAAKNTGVSKPYIGNRSVQWGRIDLADIDTVPMTSADLRRFRLRSGDLLVCEGGEIGRAAIWEEPIRECYFQKALHRLRPTRGYDSYLMMSLLKLWASTGFLTNLRHSNEHRPSTQRQTGERTAASTRGRGTARHRSRAVRRGRADRIAGSADRQEAGHQAGRDAGTADR